MMNPTKLLSILALIFFGVSGCSSSTAAPENANLETQEAPTHSASPTETVEVTDIHGTTEVPVKPETVVALDNRTFESLEDWDVKLAAVPKGVMSQESEYVQNEEVLDIGNHREPDLEVIAAVEPDVVVVGQRFASYYEDIREIVPEAVVLDFSFDVSGEKGNPGENLVEGFKHTNRELGKIFGKEKEAEQLIADFEQSLEAAAGAYKGEDTIMSVIVSGRNIGYSAPGNGRVWGPLYEIFGWSPAIAVGEGSSNHKGDDISVEAIAESNPEWILVLDRDAAVSASSHSQPAKDVIEESNALENTTAVQKEQIIYAPAETYTNESIQTYTELFHTLSEAFQ